MNTALDWYTNGPPCLYCGERVEDAKTIVGLDGVIFKGMCKSETCKKLPPGGNPFIFMIEKGEEE